MIDRSPNASHSVESIGVMASLPPMEGEITLSDFLVVYPDENTAVVSYKVTAFFGSEYVTSVWAYRDTEWVTVFYQGTPILEPAPPVADEPDLFVVFGTTTRRNA